MRVKPIPFKTKQPEPLLFARVRSEYGGKNYPEINKKFYFFPGVKQTITAQEKTQLKKIFPGKTEPAQLAVHVWIYYLDYIKREEY
jgi:hypothetical protein